MLRKDIPEEPIRPKRCIDNMDGVEGDGTRQETRGSTEEGENREEEEPGRLVGEDPEESVVLHQRVPYKPSREERRRHNVNHWPYRSWCKHCIKGKAKASPHRAADNRKSEEKELPTVCFDYMFLDGSTPILVFKEKKSKAIFAHIVDQKGVGDGHLVERVVKDIDSMGYGRITVKSDQEPAIKDLTRELREQRWEDMHGLTAAVKSMRSAETLVDLTNVETIVEHSPVDSSQSNGFIERAIQDLQGQIRSVKPAIEEMIGMKIPSG